METEVNGITYRIGRLNPTKQFHIARRLAPALWAMAAAAIKSAPPAPADGQPQPVEPEVSESAIFAMQPVAEAVAKLSDEDSEYVLNNCLLVCQRKVGEDKWQAVKIANAPNLQFSDIGLKEMMELTFAVIQENLGSFFQDPSVGQKA